MTTRTFHSISQRSHFLRLRTSKLSFGSGPVRIVYAPPISLCDQTSTGTRCCGNASSIEPGIFLAFSLRRQYGNAVQRNKVRRRIRGMLRDEQLIFLDGSYLFCITAGAKELSYAELRTHVQRALMFLSRKCS